jgi:hypothetical protein
MGRTIGECVKYVPAATLKRLGCDRHRSIGRSIGGEHLLLLLDGVSLLLFQWRFDPFDDPPG